MEPTDTERHAGIETRAFEGGAVLELSGAVDVSSIGRLHAEALGLASGGGSVILDWADCPYLDAAVLQTLFALQRRLEADGGSLRVGHDAPGIRAWLEMAGAGSLLPAPSDQKPLANTRRS
jgi:anti-anti-sigma regulatory factor